MHGHEMMEHTGESTLLTKKFVISGSNLAQVVILILMAIVAFAVLLMPNGRDDEIFNAYTLATSIGFGLLVLVGVYEVKHGQGSTLEIALYLAVGMIIRSHPDVVLTQWQYVALGLLGFYLVMMFWNVLGGRYGIWHIIRAKLSVPSISRPRFSFGRNRNHPEEDEIVEVESED